MIYCTDMRCKYNNDKNKCTNKKVQLNFMGINTVNQGYQHLLKCESFEESELYKSSIKILNNL